MKNFGYIEPQMNEYTTNQPIGSTVSNHDITHRLHNGRCLDCGTSKPIEDTHADTCKFHSFMSEQYGEKEKTCKDCGHINGHHSDRAYRELMILRAKRGRQKYRATIEKYRRNLKQDALNAYGGKCACCGVDNYEFMAIDHINGGGNKHRKENKTGSGLQFYRWLKKNKYPKGFQILCANCNWIKRFENNESNNSKRGRVRKK